MRIEEVVDLLGARILNPGLNMSRSVAFAFSSDLMSDVLTRDYEDAILITGLANLQSIRTAEMSDIGHVIIARNKEAHGAMEAFCMKAIMIMNGESLFMMIRFILNF